MAIENETVPTARRGGRRRSSREYVDGVLRTLWPDPAQITDRGRIRSRAVAGHIVEYIVVPSRDRPMLLLPRRPLRATAAALANYKVSATGRKRLAIRALSITARLGGADLLPDRVEIRASSDGTPMDLISYLSDALGRPLIACLYFGPPRAVQKPVVQILSQRGEILGFAKIGTNDLTRDLVNGEARNLENVASKHPKHFQAPAVRHHGIWRDNAVLLQEALVGSKEVVGYGMLTRASVELANLFETSAPALAGSPFWTDLRRRVESLGPNSYSGDLANALTHIERHAARIDIPLGAGHGDWTPWNMARRHGVLAVWDWEHLRLGIPKGFDALHYDVQAAVVRQGLAPKEAMAQMTGRAERLLAPFGVVREQARVVALLYAIDLASRYLQDGEADAGTRMGRLDSWLPEILARHVNQVDDPP